MSISRIFLALLAASIAASLLPHLRCYCFFALHLPHYSAVRLPHWHGNYSKIIPMIEWLENNLASAQMHPP